MCEVRYHMLSRIFGRHYSVNLQTRLILGFFIATAMTGLIATIVGIRTINKNTISEVQGRVQQDLNAAGLIYDYALERLATRVQFSAECAHLQDAIKSKDTHSMEAMNTLIRSICQPHEAYGFDSLDMLTVLDADGIVIYRAFNQDSNGDDMSDRPIVRKCLSEKRIQISTELMPEDLIRRENPSLADQVPITVVKTPQSAVIEERELSEGMVMQAAYPVVDDDGELIGAIIGGVVLNNNYNIVDIIQKTVYRNEKYQGRDMGYATIFQGGIRVSTNVMTEEGARAVGTIVSKEVYDHVINEGKDWVDRAFVVNDWYISAYRPIYNSADAIIGMLYTGILEAKYRDIKSETMWLFLSITFFGMILAFLISVSLGNSIIKRIRMLKRATEAIAAGDLDYRLAHDEFSGFGMLDEAFDNMTRSLKDRDDRLQEAFKRLTRTERLAALGQMAAGVAHEINNPLGGILLYSNLVMEELPEDHPARINIEKIIYQTERSKKIVENLLDFARTPPGEQVTCDINSIIQRALGLVKDQSIFLGVTIETHFAENVPCVKAECSRLEEVFLNLFFNAADAMAGKGTLTVTTRVSSTRQLVITVADTGKGIARPYLAHIFEPFFTTKEPGHGTGLGLSIAYGIIKKHNGIIDVDSEKGRGTTFTITFPVIMGPEDDKANENGEAETI